MDCGESLLATGNDIMLSLPLPVGPGGRPRQQPPATTGRIRAALPCVTAPPDVAEIFVEHILLSIFTSASVLPQLDDEDSILPHKLQAALEHVLDRRKELVCERGDLPSGEAAFSHKMDVYMCVYLCVCVSISICIYLYIYIYVCSECL